MADITSLAIFIKRHPRLFVVTGAGISTASRIPDYRDNDGNWKRKQPVMFKDFMTQEITRKRYWGRSLVGWQYFSRAEPNAAHKALVTLENAEYVELVVTQNVDELHQRAGQKNLLPLHGNIGCVRCMGCASLTDRDVFQQQLCHLNPQFSTLHGTIAPDGDADLKNVDFSELQIPPCERCGGILKPDAVFYGESVPRERYHRSEAALTRAEAVLIIGTSLMVYSSYRLAKLAAQTGKPIAAVNLGRTRADELFTLKIQIPAEEALPQLTAAITE